VAAGRLDGVGGAVATGHHATAREETRHDLPLVVPAG
jgi:hypothetical protein